MKEKVIGNDVGSKIIRAIIEGDKQKLFDITVHQDGPENAFFKYFRKSDMSVKAYDEKDLEQMYLKGVYDGMDLFYNMANSIYEEMESARNEE